MFSAAFSGSSAAGCLLRQRSFGYCQTALIARSVAAINCRQLHMRERYVPPPSERLNYFPGHMHSGLLQIDARLRCVDVVLEVHDARVPLSGRQPRFAGSTLTSRCHVLVLNKSDRVTQQQRDATVRHLTAEHGGNLQRRLVFTNCLQSNDAGLRSLVDTVVAALREHHGAGISGGGRYAHQLGEYQCMVLGVPNVGKSSLINALRALHLRQSGRRRRAATPVGARAGVTRSVLNRIRVCEQPRLYVLDTPGVLAPRTSRPEQMLRLALCAALQDHLVGPENLADYLLYWLNRRRLYDYVRVMGVDAPTDNIDELLRRSAEATGLTMRRSNLAAGGALQCYPDMHQAAKNMIEAFRSGALGQLLLDDELMEEEAEHGHHDGGL